MSEVKVDVKLSEDLADMLRRHDLSEVLASLSWACQQAWIVASHRKPALSPGYGEDYRIAATALHVAANQAAAHATLSSVQNKS